MKLLVMGCVGGYCGCNGSFLVIAVGFFFFFYGCGLNFMGYNS